MTSSIPHLRLANQRIVASSFRSPLEVVRGLCAMQAQDFAGAKWAIGLRVPGCTEADVDAAITSGRIVRSWPMRGTLHFTAAEDLNWMLALLTPRIVKSAAARHASLGLDERTFGRAREIALELLADRHALTRDDLLAAFDERGVSTEGQRGYHILGHLSHTGTLCFGAPCGKQHTFVLLDGWVKKPRRLERDEALGELARRYFASHGPATMRDFVAWTKLTAGDAKRGLAVATKHLESFADRELTYVMARDARDRLASAEQRGLVMRSVVALPAFDEYLLGYRDRGAVLPAKYSDAIVPGGNGVFKPTLVADGQVVGTWRREAKKKETLLDVLPFGRARLSPWVRDGLVHAAAAYGRFLGTETASTPSAAATARSSRAHASCRPRTTSPSARGTR